MSFTKYYEYALSCFEEEALKKRVDCSLYQGLCGFTIAYFLLNKYTGSQVFLEKAELALIKISNHISSVRSLDYDNGLSGIGWSIEWMKQNDFININTDEILEDIDIALYNATIYTSTSSWGLEKGTLSKCAYFMARYKSTNPYAHRFKTIYIHECLVILTDDLLEKLCSSKNLFPEIRNNYNFSYELVKVGQALYFLTEALKYKINLQTIEKPFYDLTSDTGTFLKKHCTSSRLRQLTSDNIFGLQYLAYVYFLVCKENNLVYSSHLALQLLSKLVKVDKLSILDTHRQLFIHALLNNLIDTEDIKHLKLKTNTFLKLDSDASHEISWLNKILIYLALESPRLTNWGDILKPYSFAVSRIGY